MDSAIFNRGSDLIVGTNREPNFYEDKVLLPYTITLSKTISETTSNQIQKTDLEGNPLFKDNIVIDEITGEESYDEVTTSQKITAYETVINNYRIATDQFTQELQNVLQEDGSYQEELVNIPVYETITTNSEVPVSYEQLEPIMIPEIISKTYTFLSNPYIFTADEIVEAKKTSIETAKNKTLIYYDENFTPAEFAVLNGSTGAWFISINPNAEIITEKITLESEVTEIEIYVESQNGIDVEVGVSPEGEFLPVVGGLVTLNEVSNEIFVKFKNLNGTRRELYAYGILV